MGSDATISFECVTPETLDEAEQLARSRLDEDDVARLRPGFESNPRLAVLCRVVDGPIIGVCFGSASGDVASIRGIAVAYEWSGQGIGSDLIRYYQEACREAGFDRIVVGSAGGYVEHFYMKNGFKPIEYYIPLNREPTPNDLEGLDVIRIRHEGEKIKLNIRAEGYDLDRKEELRRRFDASDVAYIFEMNLAGALPGRHLNL
jgi:N-acetylglutamate synthase-like GNAT family acetyltransferase